MRIVLRPARGRVRARVDANAGELKRKIQAGPAGIWRYADFLPFADRPRDPLEPGLTPLVRADRLAERLGLGELWVKNDAANPTHSFKDRVVAVAVAKAQELGFETVACASTGNLANAVAAHAAAAGLDSYVFVPVQPRGAEAARHGRLRHQPRWRARQLRRRQPPLHPALRGAPVGVREREPAPVLRRGLEDARLRDGRAARLDASGPGRRADRVGLALHEDRARLHRVARRWASSPASCRRSTARRRPAARRSRRRTPRAGTSASRRSPTRSPRASRSANPADGPYALELARNTGGAIDSVTRRRDPRRHPPAGGDDRASSPRPPAASRSPRWRSSPSAATSTATSASSPTSRATA